MGNKDIEKVAVVGAGTMGHGIAEVCALAGLDVGITDVKQELLDRAMESVRKNLGKLANREKISESEKEKALRGMNTDVDLDSIVSPADLAIEAVPEKMEIKRDVFRGIDESAPEDAILATNTSSLSVTELASITSRPEKFLGIHFFNPPVKMKLVEIVEGEETDEEVIRKAMDFARELGKEPVYCRKDSAGFIVNAILFPYLLEAVRLREINDLCKETIDSAVVEKLNFPMGPFELLDMVGLDVAKEIGEVIDWPVPSLVEEKVKKDLLGRKSGEGFYNYRSKGVDYAPEDGEEFDPLPLLALMANQAGEILEKKVASADDIDLAMKLGAGLPKGPITLSEEKGLEKMRRGLSYLSGLGSTSKERYEPSGPLKEGFGEYEF